MSGREADQETRYRRGLAWARVAVHELRAPLLDSGIDFRSAVAMTARSILIRQTDYGFYFLPIPPETLEKIIRSVRVDAATYDLCSNLIAAGTLYDAKRTMVVEIEGEYVAQRALNCMPDGLRLLASLMTSGKIPRPVQRGASTEFVRNFRLVLLVDLTAKIFRLTPSRGANTRPRRSACDAVLEAMRLEGIEPMSFDALRGVWQNTKLRKQVQLYLAGERVKVREARARGGDAPQTRVSTTTEEEGNAHRPSAIRPVARAFQMLIGTSKAGE